MVADNSIKGQTPKVELTPNDQREVDIFRGWLLEDERVKRVAQSLAILTEDERVRALTWSEYLQGDASALNVNVSSLQ